MIYDNITPLWMNPIYQNTNTNYIKRYAPNNNFDINDIIGLSQIPPAGSYVDYNNVPVNGIPVFNSLEERLAYAQNYGQNPWLQVADLQTSYKDLINSQTELQKMYAKNLNDYLNSWQYKYLKPASEAIGALSTLGNLYLGFQGYKLAKEQLSMAREQWATTKDELNRIKNLRTSLTNAYLGK